MNPTTRRTGILLGERHTSVFNRLVAKAIDLLVVVAILLLGKAFWVPAGILAACFLVSLQDAMGEGQSVGKRIMGLRVIEYKTGQACSLSHSVTRNIPFILAVVFGSMPLLWVFFLLISLPILIFEIFVILTVDSGVRLGDILANTLVVED